MAISLTPTLTAQQWGPHPWQLFDYYAHATRDAGGNPLLIVRHVGGGTGGYYGDLWTTDRMPANFVRYIHSTASLGLHFDVMSIETAQRSFDTITAANKKLILSQAFDMQIAISTVKRLGVSGFGGGTYVADPRRYSALGDSHGSNIVSLSQLLPASSGPHVWASTDSLFDSSLNSIIYHIGQPDVRLGYLAFNALGGFFAASVDSATESNALPTSLRQSASTTWYIESGNTRGYVPHYVIYAPLGDHALPLSNAHDSKQGTDLVAALAARALPYGSNLTSAEADWIGTGPTAVANQAALYTWLAGKTTAASTQSL